jgi:hypothetical protein
MTIFLWTPKWESSRPFEWYKEGPFYIFPTPWSKDLKHPKTFNSQNYGNAFVSFEGFSFTFPHTSFSHRGCVWFDTMFWIFLGSCPLSCPNFYHELKVRVTTWMVIGWRKLKGLFNKTILDYFDFIGSMDFYDPSWRTLQQCSKRLFI